MEKSKHYIVVHWLRDGFLKDNSVCIYNMTDKTYEMLNLELSGLWKINPKDFICGNTHSWEKNDLILEEEALIIDEFWE